MTYTHRDASIDGAHHALTNGVLSALIIEGALCRMDHTITETSDYHPYMCT